MLSGLSSLDALLGVGFAGFLQSLLRMLWFPGSPGWPRPRCQALRASPSSIGGMVFLGRPASWHLWRVLGSDGAVDLVFYGDPFAVDFITSVFDSGAFSPDSFSLPRLAEM